jgi:hypothetical protein
VPLQTLQIAGVLEGYGMKETRFKVSAEYHHKSPGCFMGRFGGGWNWMVGVRAGGQTLILHCLVFDVVFKVERPEEQCL